MESEMPLNFAEMLTNYELGSHRFRIGNYRAAFDVEGETIVILTVKHGREIYRG
jgi:mRNA-degrading endonuclease RelE of RelBE toxin-antitoxin system